ncbi:MAG TPA: agmatinase [Acidimicrobiia bacterium]
MSWEPGRHFANRPTFAGVASVEPGSLGTPDVVIVGAPFDWGTTFRPGTRFGPRAIRNADYLSPDGARPHLATGIDPLQVLDVVDAGDIGVIPGYLDPSMSEIAKAVEAIAAMGATPIVLGGDHTITFPDATGVAKVSGFGSVALVHFDAHADTGEDHWGMLHGHGTPMRRLIESGAVPGHRFVQIGLRGYWPPPKVVSWMQEQGMRSYLMSDITQRGLDPIVDEAVAHASSGASGVFLSIDIDVVDPGMAPGTGTPEPGGLTSRQLLDTVRRLARDLNVIGADVVEVSPPYDGPGEITAFLANRVVLEILNGMAERRVGP